MTKKAYDPFCVFPLGSYVLANGGGTFGVSIDGRELLVVEYSNGFAVSKIGTEAKYARITDSAGLLNLYGQLVTVEQWIEFRLKGYLETHSRSLTDEFPFIGAWIDGETLVIDQTAIHSSPVDVLRIARDQRQTSIYDFENGCSVYLSNQDFHVVGRFAEYDVVLTDQSSLDYRLGGGATG